MRGSAVVWMSRRTTRHSGAGSLCADRIPPRWSGSFRARFPLHSGSNVLPCSFPYIRLPMQGHAVGLLGRFPLRAGDGVLGCPSWRPERYPNDSCYACKRDEGSGKAACRGRCGRAMGTGKNRQGRGEVPPECPKGIAECACRPACRRAESGYCRSTLRPGDSPQPQKTEAGPRELCRDRRKELRREEFRHSMGEGRFPEV